MRILVDNRLGCLFVVRLSKKYLHKVPSAVENTDDVNLVALKLIKCGVVTTYKETVRHFKIDNRGKRRTDFGEIRKLTDALHNLLNRVDCRLLTAQLVSDVRFDLLQIFKGIGCKIDFSHCLSPEVLRPPKYQYILFLSQKLHLLQVRSSA